MDGKRVVFVGIVNLFGIIVMKGIVIIIWKFDIDLWVIFWNGKSMGGCWWS